MPTGTLPEAGKKLWEKVYNDSKGPDCDDACAAKKAWGAVSNAGWSKDDKGVWHKKAELEEFSLNINKLQIDPVTNVRRWKADTSDTIVDSRGDNMTIELFQSFIKRIKEDEPAPEEFRSEFWDGGKPYVSISHYSDQNGRGVPGEVEEVFVNGRFLKAKGVFYDTPLGNAAWNALWEDKTLGREDKTRISIGFLDYAHIHKSNGYSFVRKSLDEICPECLKERMNKERQGRSFVDGMLVHFALTRVPANKRTDISPDDDVMEVRSMTTKKQDAASIVGEELAEELDTGELEEKALVEFSEVEEKAAHACPKCGKKVNPTSEGKCPECGAKMEGEYAEDEKEEKSEAVPAEPTVELSEILAAIGEIKEILTAKSEVVETPVVQASEFSTSPLYPAIQEFLSDFEQVYNSNADNETKLREAQAPFAALGNRIVEVFTPKAEVVENSTSTSNNDLVQALSAVMNPLVEKLDMLLAKSEQTTSPATGVPPRRSLSYALPAAQNKALIAEPELEIPGKPVSISSFAKKSTGLG